MRPTTKQLLLGILLIALAVRLPNIATHLPGTDEALTLNVAAGQPWGTASFEFFHPPLFFFIVQTVQLFPEPVLLLRLLMVAAGVATVLVTFFFGRDLAGSRLGLLAAFLVTINPMSVIYSQHGRPYILFSLLYLLSTWLLYRFLFKQDRRGLLALPGIYALAFYNHYLSALFIAAHVAVVAGLRLRRPIAWKPYVAVLLVTGLLVAPILLHFLTNVADLSQSPQTWMGSLTPLTFPYPVYKYAVMADISTVAAHYPPVAALFPVSVALAALGLWRLYREDRKKACYLAGVFLLVFVFSAIASLYILIYFFRYLTYLLPVYLLLMAFGLEKQRPWLRAALLVAFIVGWAVVLQDYFTVSLLGDWAIDFAV
ncbi:MAG: glycosyltransferase family 39 protein [Candidatus Aenigmarchaeota archaeon]|nr:glycosyltransferase family 39 protein [Candidatus Aenigmarchaeota archaeon]